MRPHRSYVLVHRFVGLLAVVALLLSAGAVAAETADQHQVKSLEIMILSTMLTQTGVGEWGFAAIVEADGHRQVSS